MPGDRRIKIVFFSDSLRAGGKERQLFELTRQLTATGQYLCTVVTMSHDNHYFPEGDYDVRYLIRDSKKDLKVFLRFINLMRELGPDIIHTWDSMTSIYAVPAAKLLGIRLVNGMIRDAPPALGCLDHRLVRARIAFPFSDAVVANSLAGLAAYRMRGRKGSCIYNAFDFGRMHPDKISEVRPSLRLGAGTVVGMVATFGDNKDYPTFIKAAELVLKQRQDVTFIAVGEGTDSSECTNLVSPGLEAYFRFLGKRSGIESLVSIFDIGVLCTGNRHGEGISNSVTEYMAAGIPVVATDAGGTCELVQDGRTGFLIGRGDYKVLAQHLLALIQDQDLCCRMGTAGRQRIRDEFSPAKMVRSYASLYRSLVELT